jgi:peroxiredoxin
VHLAAFKKKKAIVLVFFATWCPHCREELPQVAKLREAYGDRGLEVFLISQETATRLREFPDLRDIPFPVLVDPYREVHAAYEVQGIPATILIDREGKIAAHLAGYSPAQFEDEFLPAVRKLLMVDS